MKINHILLLIICGITLISCDADKTSGVKTAGPKTWDVKLKVSGPANNPVMKVINPGMSACRNASPGCMRFHQETGEVTFNLDKHPRNYRVVEFKICMGSTPPSPPDADCKLPAANAMDFYVEGSSGGLHVPNTLDGKITWAYNSDIKSFVLYNRNIEVQDYYYMVRACPGAGDCAVTDPILENKGMY